ncbi:MAG: hypothetical protein II600_01110, partial [Bacteroidaceae bacterium]|nr:hypothetical protein [Bacteroidaceae bacterium]
YFLKVKHSFSAFAFVPAFTPYSANCVPELEMDTLSRQKWTFCPTSCSVWETEKHVPFLQILK